MTPRLGVAIAHDAVRAVLVRRDAVVWAAEVQRSVEGDIERTLESILREAPVRRWPRATVAAAVGPHAAQVKRISGLPLLDDAATLAAVIKESVGSFFLTPGVPLTTTGVRPVGEGVAWAGAIETPTVEAVRDACTAADLKLGLIVPSVVALPLGLLDESFGWRDGALVVQITRSSDGLEAIRRQPVCITRMDERPPEAVSALAGLGREAHRFADAYGAAVLTPSEELSIGPTGVAVPEMRHRTRPFVVPAALGALAIVSFFLSPLAAVWSGRRAGSSLREMRSSEQWHVMEATFQQLEPITESLDEIDAFARSRPERTRMLGELARMLGTGSVVLSIDMDRRGGRVVALTSDVADVLDAIRAMPGVDSLGVLGQITRETVGAREMDRVMVGFRTADPAPAGEAR